MPNEVGDGHNRCDNPPAEATTVSRCNLPPLSFQAAPLNPFAQGRPIELIAGHGEHGPDAT
jgi:hypothetical protein